MPGDGSRLRSGLVQIDGRVDAEFEAVVAAFERNFGDLGEIGAAVVV
jgi:hypothetical protein